ncbi:MAG: ATP-dependent DNA helicase RecG [Acidobacteriia bacterium]|nr:ATP-dependent DNA helicase RecG [Terriglobia bacterium]
MSSLDLNTSVQYLKGVGPRRAELLIQRGIEDVGDLLTYAPFRYEDRIHFSSVRDLRVGQPQSILVTVLSCGLSRTRRRGMFIYDLAARDASGLIRCKWFNGAYLEQRKVFKQGMRVIFYGKPEPDPYGYRNLQFLNPQFEILPEESQKEGDGFSSSEMGRIVPVYEAIGQLNTRHLRRLIASALATVDLKDVDPLPHSIGKRLGFPGRATALSQFHFPDSSAGIETLNSFRTRAQQRMIFEEFFLLEVGLALKRRRARKQPGICFQTNESIRAAIKKILPFHPTGAQKRVLREIVDDMRSPSPMNRLLQGDVGSGKTIVALQSMIIAICNGYQTVLMAPTEILSVQHYLYAKRIFAPIGVRIALLTSALKRKERTEVQEALRTGELDLVVGTHAVLEKDIEFKNLGLIVIDEQHRFGVMQRLQLKRKGLYPDTVVMTATPIPRTLALTLYGDLDFSVINEMPPHRQPIETRWVKEEDRGKVIRFVRQQVSEGSQVYVVCPLIEESEASDLKAAVAMYEDLSVRVFPDFKVGLLHGRLSNHEKDDVMAQMAAGALHILVSTTVIEVGVDVPNATLMMVEHAERFGLAQLHQLRGRIGRGQKKSYCFLMTSEIVSDEAQRRLKCLEQTRDGFKIAELDLEIRGPGEFFGTKQSGLPLFRFGNLIRDQDLLELAKREASAFVERPPTDPEFVSVVQYLRAHWSRRFGLLHVG